MSGTQFDARHRMTSRARAVTALGALLLVGASCPRGAGESDAIARGRSARASVCVDSSSRGPIADHHQHLFGPVIVRMANAPERVWELSGDDLVRSLTAARIDRAVVLSLGYQHGSPTFSGPDEYDRVRAENDWTSEQVLRHGDRLIGFCSVNPLKPYALAEIRRCAGMPGLRTGLKLHFGNSDVVLDDSAHLAQLRDVVRLANELRMTLSIHMRANISRGRPYGAAQARIFIDELLPLATDIPVQIAHLAGTGPGYRDPPADSALVAFIEAIAQRDPRVARLWFDVSGVVTASPPPPTLALVAQRIRQIGVDRVLFGSDGGVAGNLLPREAWAAFCRLPLTQAEFLGVANNVAPWLR